MNQRDLNRAVARATGESMGAIRRLGFSLLEPEGRTDTDLAEMAPQLVDWDAVEAERMALAILA